MSNMVRGAMMLTIASFLSKFLGMIYVIPFNALVGETGGVLYSFAYTPYNIILSLSTIGVPLAVSKFVSKYNAMGDYETGRRMFKAGISLLMVSGFLAFLVLFFSAEWLAGNYITDEDAGSIAVEDVTFVIRMVSFALIIIPAMSIVRGFFQGYQSMGPTAVSQVVEQVVRIVFLLTAAFIVMIVLDGEVSTAVGFATFAAFIGGGASALVLWGYWRKRKPGLDKRLQQQTYTNEIPRKDLFIELFSYAGPFIIVGLATSLYQLVDQFTFERAMVARGEGNIWEIAFAVINFYGHKLVIIPVTLATGLSLAIIPALTKIFTQKNHEELYEQINQAFQIVLVLVIPAVVGLSFLSEEAYGALYGLGNIEITGNLLGWYAPVGLLFALFTVSSAVLQGINEQKYAVISLTGGLLVKILLNIQLIHMFGAKGAIFGTALAVGTAVTLNLLRIKSKIQFSFRKLIKRTMLIAIFVSIMCLVIWVVMAVFGMFLPYETERWATILMLVLGVGSGGAVYLWLAYESTLLERTLGNRVRVLDKIFRR
ncbi:O-antigen/teichoic acid export membrane protein [Virgibacillus natechei]|uniref:O-antigen/teichoic acid export membrane protein n=1 Tax=Virgibacillus natechei TaxID=1216297 RepID=A0ABS4IDG2_9BACI|nr:polysaccharide biosynthesis protein [Virgibacillus natechei]MBP1968940.1 O-antigen/teichoic acid export membrane protein [Virgibacillus natechei]UZD11730.1 polysaccharide biosynthesis protein [Virgibacillus natechei]